MAVPEKIELSKIEVEERRILRLIGYKKPPAEIKPSLRELIDREKKELASLLQNRLRGNQQAPHFRNG